MSTDQGKLAYQLILVTNAFLRPVNEYEEKGYTCHTIRRVVSKAVQKCWTGRS